MPYSQRAAPGRADLILGRTADGRCAEERLQAGRTFLHLALLEVAPAGPAATEPVESGACGDPHRDATEANAPIWA